MDKHYFKPLADHVKCPDGLKVSVQASRTHYCTPRNDVGPYTHVELGFPNRTPPDYILEYGDGSGDGGESEVYSYVPIELVEQWLQEHGGRIPKLSGF